MPCASTPAKAGDTITLAMTDQAASFDVILGDSKVPANGAVITLKEGQTDVRISLVQKGDITADIHTTISATFKSADPDAPQEVVSNTWGINVKDAGVASHAFTGDQRAALDPAGNYKWGETSWTVDGTLTNGVAQADFNDVISGTATADKISGMGGNDALSGGAGSDQIDGGDGDDLIGGGAGSDTIKGGAGNDVIFSTYDLNVSQRTKADEHWDMPAGDTLISKGSNWGFSKDANNNANMGLYLSGAPDDAPDVIDAGDGDDYVYAGRGDDLIQGGVGGDSLFGNGGSDVIDGGDGADYISGDDTLTYRLHAVDAPIINSAAQLRAEQPRISPVCGMASGRYACYRGPRLHRGCHTQSTHATKRTAQEVRQASTIYTANAL